MKKSDKKIENAIREALTKVCDGALESVSGFVWITHMVNYDAFPQSLRIVCVFDTDEALSNAYDVKQDAYFYAAIEKALRGVNIKLNKLPQQVSFDTEEACQRTHAGKWNERLAKVSGRLH